MADKDILREYLVKLGYQVDPAAEKRMLASLENVAKGVAGVVAAIGAAALAVGAGIASFAANMEKLYDEARRGASSASGIKALERTAENFGAAAGSAGRAVQTLASTLRKNPAVEGVLLGWGVETRDKNGNLRDTADMLKDVAKAMAGMDYQTALGFSEGLGISEDLLLAMRRDGFSEEFDKQKKIQEQMDKAAESAKRFMAVLREISDRFTAVGAIIGEKLIKALGPQMEETAKWFEQNGDKIGSVVAGIADAVIAAGSVITPVLSRIAEGWRNIYGWVKAGFDYLNQFLSKSGIGDKIGAGVGFVLDVLGNRKQVDNVLGLGGSNSSSLDPMRFFMGMGWTKAQASGIISNLRAESNMNPSAVGDNGQAYGVAQWHPDRQANFKRWSGKDIRDSTLEDQLKFVNYELTSGAERKAGDLLRASQNAQQAGDIMSRHYERPMAADAEALRRGAAAVQIAQNTTINVSGTSDPAAAGRAVADEQGRVNQNIVRNMQGVLQ